MYAKLDNSFLVGIILSPIRNDSKRFIVLSLCLSNSYITCVVLMHNYINQNESTLVHIKTSKKYHFCVKGVPGSSSTISYM